MKKQRSFRWLALAVLLLTGLSLQTKAQEVDDLQEYLDQLPTEQPVQAARQSVRQAEEVTIPIGLTEVDLSKFTSATGRTTALSVKTSVKFVNGSITSSTTFSGSNCLINISGGATVVLGATASIDASPATGTSCIYAIAIQGKSSFYQCGDIIGPGKVSGYAIYLDSADDYYYYVSGNTQGGISNPNGGKVIGLEGDPEAYAVLSTDKATLTFYYDGVKYNREGTVYTKLNSMYDSEWYGKPFTKVVFDSSFAEYDGLTDLSYWFCKCGNLQTVEGMEYLNTANVTKMNYMFAACSSLTSLDMRGLNTSNVTNMTNMFEGCNHLQTIHVGNNWSTAQVTNSNNMFYNCTSLVGGDGTKFDPNYTDKTKAYAGIGGYLTMEGQEVGPKDGDTFVAETVEGVEMTFQIISVSDMTCQVGNGKEASVITDIKGTITIPSEANGFSVIKIGDYGFNYCSGITDIKIPTSVMSIGYYAFARCYGLNSFSLPKNVSSIKDHALWWCYNIKSMSVEGGNPVYDSRGNCNAIIETASNSLLFGCQKTVIPDDIKSIAICAFEGQIHLESIIIPESVTEIDRWAFKDCQSLSSANIPSNVKVLSESIFWNCKTLKSIAIPDGVTEIGFEAFKLCQSLTSIDIPSSVSKLNTGAFYGCNNLTSVTSHILEPFVIPDNTFTNFEAILYVPIGTVEKYKALAAWNKFLNIMEIGSSDEPDDLQGWLDQLTQGDDKGTEENPVGVEIPGSGLDVSNDVTIDDDLQALLDGLAGKEGYQTEVPTIRMKPGTRIFIKRGSSLTIRNLVFEGTEEDQFIDVSGTLIIDVNVYIYRFRRFIYVHDGGRVIWRNGNLETVEEGIANHGGQVEYRGGSFRGGSYGIDNRNGGITYIYGGEISGGSHGIYNDRESYIYLINGKIDGGIENHGKLRIEGGEIFHTGDNPHVIENYEDSELTITGGTIGENGTGSIWSETDFWIDGNVYVQDIHIKRGVRLHIIGKLNVYWRIHFFVIDEFDIFVPIIIGDNGYELTEENCRYLQIDLPEGYRWIYHEGTIIIVRIPYDVTTIVEYLEFFGPQGTNENPWSFVYNTTNIGINVDWYIHKGYHLLFDGGKFTMSGGNIYINEGSSMRLKNIRFTGNDYHIYVYGTLYIDEEVDFDAIKKFIHLCKGGQIRFVTQPTYIVNIFISEEDIVTYKAIITDIQEEWLQNINIELSEGYRWIFVDGTIVIVRIPYDVTTIEELLAYFGPQGTLENPWSFVYNTTNINININWHVLSDYHLIFDGGLFTMTGGDIYIDKGASLWLKNIRFTGERHIYVNGVLIIDDEVVFADIIKFVHLLKGGKIIVKKRLKSKLNVVVGDVAHGEILAISGLTEDDLANLDISLPDGYTWEFDNGTIVVKEPAVVVTAKSYTREYGESNPEFEYASEGAPLNGIPEISCEATESSPIGTYPIIIKKGGVKNYNDNYVNGTLTITKAPLTISGGEYTMKQGEALPEFAATYSGFKNVETSAVLTKQPTLTTTATSASAPGTYEVIVSGAEAQNYEISYVNGTLKVTDADAVIVTAKNYTRVYGDANPTFEYEVSGATLEGQPEISCEATATSPVGTYPITIKKGSVTNYNDTYVNGTLTITRTPLTVTVGNYTRQEGEDNPEFVITYEGWKNNEDESVLTTKPVASTVADKESATGDYPITVAGGEALNYSFTYVGGTLTVTPKPEDIILDVTIDHERATGLGYTPTEAEVDFTEAKSWLGVDAITTDLLNFENPDGTLIDYATYAKANYDGWCNGEGMAENWGNTTMVCVKFFEAIPDGKFTFYDMNGADEDGKTYTVRWRLVNGEKVVRYTINVTFKKPAATELEVVDKGIVASVTYDIADADYVEQKVTLTDEQVAAICAELGISDLSEATAYGYNPTAQELVKNHAGFDGWRDANGDFHNWNADGTQAPACVKYTNGKEYLCYNRSVMEPQTIKTYWAIANDKKAVLVEIDFIYLDATADPDNTVKNWNCSGSDVSSFWVHEWRTMDAQADGPANIVDGCVKVYVRSFAQAEAAGNATLKDGNKENMTLDNFADWDSQFFITWDEAKATAAGDKLQLKMKVKGDKAQTIASQLHKAPGAYVHWYAVGDINVTTEWTDFVSAEVDVVSGDPGYGKTAEGCWTIAFNLAKGEENTFYFDDMVVYVIKPTGITEMYRINPESGVRYNLSGKRVDDSYKGIVIMNGKKIFIK